jgi:uncharacterized membrane protein
VRFIASAIFLVLGLVLGIIGVGQKTFWAPSDTITASADIDADAPVAVIEPGVLNLYDVPTTVKVQGTGPLTVSQASKENIDAWVGEDTRVTRITGLQSSTELATTTGDGKDTSVPDPAGGELFTKQDSGDDEITLTWKDDAGRTAFLLAGDGKAGEVTSVSISWLSHASTPWATTLIVLGILALAAAVVLGILAIRSSRQERARRTRRQERRRRLAETGSTVTAEVPLVGAAAAAAAGTVDGAAGTAADSAAAGAAAEDATTVLPKTDTGESTPTAVDAKRAGAKSKPDTVEPEAGKPAVADAETSAAEKTGESEPAKPAAKPGKEQKPETGQAKSAKPQRAIPKTFAEDEDEEPASPIADAKAQPAPKAKPATTSASAPKAKPAPKASSEPKAKPAPKAEDAKRPVPRQAPGTSAPAPRKAPEPPKKAPEPPQKAPEPPKKAPETVTKPDSSTSGGDDSER